MTVPRKELVDETIANYYHCWSRCVRRAFLCGADTVSGNNFEHRRGWIEQRLALLGQAFAVDIAAYAVMSNHVHSVLRNRPDIAQSWTAKEVARRWLLVFPAGRKAADSKKALQQHIEAIAMNKKLVQLYRQRLSSISWFQRCLNEWIARKANKEDDCTGHFWEGRFRSERLDTAAAVVACSVYVDLNPIRAKMAMTPEGSDFTSVKARINECTEIKRRQGSLQMLLKPALIPARDFSEEGLSELEYLRLVDLTGRLIREGSGHIPDELRPILERLKLAPDSWLTMQNKKRDLFKRVIGPVSSLRKIAGMMGKKCLHGVRGARMVFC